MSIPSWAKVGAKCICVDGRLYFWAPGVANSSRPPVKGEIYTIVASRIDIYGDARVFIEGCPNLKAFDPTDHGWGVERFRPVKTIEDDISEHFAILLRTPSKVDA